MDWHKCSESFIHIVDNQSFTKTAKKRFTSSSALSKHVNWLESQLGVQLLQRTTRHLELTEEGERFYHRAKYLLDEWCELKEDIQDLGGKPHGTLNIGLSIVFGYQYIVPLLPDLLKQCPHLKLNLQTITYPYFMDLENIDIAFSMKPPDFFSEKMDYRTLGEYHSYIYASPEYLERYGEPQSLEELKNHNCLLYSGRDYPNRWKFENRELQVNSNFISDSGVALVKAAIDGIGMLFASDFLINIDSKGELKKVLPDCRSPAWNIYAYYPKRKKLSLKTEWFLSHIASRLNI